MIPKLLHRIWVGGEMPAHLARFSDDWRRLHPDWELRVWTDRDFGWLQNQDMFDNAGQYVPADAVGQFKSDLARYEILQRHGGVYVDCDVEPLLSFDDLLDVACFAGWELTGKYVGNTVLGSVPGHTLWRDMIAQVRITAEQNKGKAATWLTGPRVLTDVVSAGSYDGLQIYPQRHFYPYSYADVKADGRDPSLSSHQGSYAVHHWEHVRTQRGRQLKHRSKAGVVLSATIMAHPKRKQWVPGLQKQLGDCQVTWDKYNDRHETGLRALQAHDPNATHHLVVQDDAVLSRDFVQGVQNALQHTPRSAPVCFYMGRVNPNLPDLPQLIGKARKQRPSFIVFDGPWWGVAIAYPTDSIDRLIAYYQASDAVNYDRRVSRFYGAEGIKCHYAVPSIADHRVEGNPSLVAGRQNRGRNAWNYVGARSAASIDWSGAWLTA